VWVSPALAGEVSALNIRRQARGWEQPSDHVPVTVKVEL
jgi:exodeoxyribonuclease-3